MLDYARRYGGDRVLDYGCGTGELVVEGRRRGLPIEGAEVFYAGGDARAQAAATGLLGTHIHEIRDGRLPCGDGTYDLVLSNQVFEHVEDLDQVLAEIARVLRPGGRLLSLFPSREVWREGHCGVPFLHRMAPDKSLTHRYAVAARRLGLGYHKGDKKPQAWADELIDWVARYCHYRPQADIERAYLRLFDIEWLEEAHAAYRLRQHGADRAARVVQLPGIRRVVRLAMRKLAHMTFVARKPAATAQRADATHHLDSNTCTPP